MAITKNEINSMLRDGDGVLKADTRSVKRKQQTRSIKRKLNNYKAIRTTSMANVSDTLEDMFDAMMELA